MSILKSNQNDKNLLTSPLLSTTIFPGLPGICSSHNLVNVSSTPSVIVCFLVEHSCLCSDARPYIPECYTLTNAAFVREYNQHD